MSKSRIKCCVRGCTSSYSRNPLNFSFYAFPKPGANRVFVENIFGKNDLIDRKKAWSIKLKIGPKISTKYMKVCSLHFKKKDVITNGRNLKRNAVPSLNLPDNTIATTNKNKHETNISQKKKIANRRYEECIHIKRIFEVEEQLNAFANLVENEASEESSGGLTEDELIAKMIRDASVQVTTPQKVTVLNLIGDSKEALTSYTGLQNFQLLQYLVDSVKLIYTDKRIHNLSIRERIILTFIKLKMNLSFKAIALLSGIEATLCKTYFTETLKLLSDVLKPAIQFPPMDEIRGNLPLCFSDFKNTQIVLDCIEICVQSPKRLCCRVSHNKSAYTVKFMIGVTPSGLISFVSRAYGGRASNTTIFEQSNIVDQIGQGAAIMADKGFLTERFCDNNDIKLYRPPFLRNMRQLTAEDSIISSKIAAARVLIERRKARLKMFDFLNGKLHWPLVACQQVHLNQRRVVELQPPRTQKKSVL